MAQTIDRLFLDFSGRKLRQLFDRISECAGKLSEEQIWMRSGEEQNAVGNLLLHLSGNVRQWIVSGLGGKPDVRVRDREFSARGQIAARDLLERLRTTLDEAVGVLDALPAERLGERVVIQKYDLTVLEAIYHVVEHFAQHTGQIIFATKLLTGRDLGFYAHLGRASEHGEQTP